MWAEQRIVIVKEGNDKGEPISDHCGSMTIAFERTFDVCGRNTIDTVDVVLCG